MQAPSPAPVFVACAVADEDAAKNAIQALLAAGVAPADISIGAPRQANDAADALAAEFGIRHDIEADDPLAGAPGLASAEVGSASINRGALIGAFAGAALGLALGAFTRLDIIPVGPTYRVLVYALVFFIVGALAGATLGGALAPQRSTHAAFRIVDEIEHHGFALVAHLDGASAPAASEALNAHGGLHVMSVPSGD
ncbi:MAG: hypothetical protein JO194_02975 [Candidatus Eremiobacteraeota bacterium]|nr:hypothetical protein [Candidatus Eremiobacteraeota bacterium]